MDYKSLVKEIKDNKIGKLYLFYGSEGYLVEKTILVIKNKYLNSSNENFNYIYHDDFKGEIDELISICETLPFMGEKRIVVVKKPEYFNGKRGGLDSNSEEKLIKYISNLPETTSLIFIGDAKIDKRLKLVKNIKKYGEIIEFNKLNEKEYIKFVKKQIRENNREIENKTLYRLIELLGYLDRDSNKTLYDTCNEIKKISNYIKGSSIIKIQDLEKIMTKPLENNIFELVDAVAEKNGDRSLKILNQMLDSGEAEGRIMYMIIRQFRILNLTKTMINKGYTAIAIAPKLKLPQFIVKKYVRQVRVFSEKDLLILLNKVLKAEKNIKTGKLPSKLAMEIFITECCNI